MIRKFFSNKLILNCLKIIGVCTLLLTAYKGVYSSKSESDVLSNIDFEEVGMHEQVEEPIQESGDSKDNYVNTEGVERSFSQVIADNAVVDLPEETSDTTIDTTNVGENKDPVTQNFPRITPEYPTHLGVTYFPYEGIKFKVSPIYLLGYTFDIELNGELVVDDNAEIENYYFGPPVCFQLSGYCIFTLEHFDLPFTQRVNDVKIREVFFETEISYRFFFNKDFTIEASSYPNPITVNDQVIYTALIRNSTLYDEKDVVVTSTFSGNVQIIDAYFDNYSNKCMISDVSVTCNLGDIPGLSAYPSTGGSRAITIIAKPLSPGVLSNEISVVSDRYHPYYDFYFQQSDYVYLENIVTL